MGTLRSWENISACGKINFNFHTYNTGMLRGMLIQMYAVHPYLLGKVCTELFPETTNFNVL